MTADVATDPTTAWTGSSRTPAPWNLDTVIDAFPLLALLCKRVAGNLSGGSSRPFRTIEPTAAPGTVRFRLSSLR